MDCAMTKNSSVVREWLDSALVSRNYTGFGYESVHLDDLLVDDYSDDVAVELGFRLLDELVSCLDGKAGEIMASLNASLDAAEYDAERDARYARREGFY